MENSNSAEVPWIISLVNNAAEPDSDHISLEQYIRESSYITQYLGRVVKDKALVVYQVLFHLSWFQTGKGRIEIPWAQVGAYIKSEQGNIIKHGSTIKRNMRDLNTHKCISTERRGGGANVISVYLPSDIAACKKLIEEDLTATPRIEKPDERDYFTNPLLRSKVFDRDGNVCVYCTIPLLADNREIDHLLPGGSNKKNNLVAACQACNGRRGKLNLEPIAFLRDNYQQKLLTQEAYFKQKQYIESLLSEYDGLV